MQIQIIVGLISLGVAALGVLAAILGRKKEIKIIHRHEQIATQPTASVGVAKSEQSGGHFAIADQMPEAVRDADGAPTEQETSTEEFALSQVEHQLQNRGFKVSRMPSRSRDGDIHARKGGKRVRFKVRGLAKRNGVFLSPAQINAVDVVVVYVVDEDNAWVLTTTQAHALLAHYHDDFVARNGRPPASPGWNSSQFPPPTGWAPLDTLL